MEELEEEALKQEEVLKKYLFDNIYKYMNTQTLIKNELEKTMKFLNYSKTSLPNQFIYFHNKINELSNIFKKNGLSIYSKINYDYDFVGNNFLGEAIIKDLFDMVNLSDEKLDKLNNTLIKIATSKIEQVNEYLVAGAIKRFIDKIKSYNSGLDISLSSYEREAIDIDYNDFYESAHSIYDYNLEDNLVGTLVNYITGSEKYKDYEIKHRYSACDVPRLVEECVIPDLKKLNLEHLIPDLEKGLVDKYKDDLDSYVSEEDMHHYVPDFSSIESGSKTI